MGLLRVSREMDRNNEIMNLVFSFLRKEHNADISKPRYLGSEVHYVINGDEIPFHRDFGVLVEEIAPKVYTVKVFNLEK